MNTSRRCGARDVTHSEACVQNSHSIHIPRADRHEGTSEKDGVKLFALALWQRRLRRFRQWLTLRERRDDHI